jgi:DNA-damage-inducible protein J
MFCLKLNCQLPSSQAFNLFLHQVALQGGIPFDIKIPNADTVEAREKLSNGGGKRYKNSQKMYDDLGI